MYSSNQTWGILLKRDSRTVPWSEITDLEPGQLCVRSYPSHEGGGKVVCGMTDCEIDLQRPDGCCEHRDSNHRPPDFGWGMGMGMSMRRCTFPAIVLMTTGYFIIYGRYLVPLYRYITSASRLAFLWPMSFLEL